MNINEQKYSNSRPKKKRKERIKSDFNQIESIYSLVYGMHNTYTLMWKNENLECCYICSRTSCGEAVYNIIVKDINLYS